MLSLKNSLYSCRHGIHINPQRPSPLVSCLRGRLCLSALLITLYRPISPTQSNGQAAPVDAHLIHKIILGV